MVTKKATKKAPQDLAKGKTDKELMAEAAAAVQAFDERLGEVRRLEARLKVERGKVKVKRVARDKAVLALRQRHGRAQATMLAVLGAQPEDAPEAEGEGPSGDRYTLPAPAQLAQKEGD